MKYEDFLRRALLCPLNFKKKRHHLRKQNSNIGRRPLAAAPIKGGRRPPAAAPPFIGSYIGVLLSLYKNLNITFDL